MVHNMKFTLKALNQIASLAFIVAFPGLPVILLNGLNANRANFAGNRLQRKPGGPRLSRPVEAALP
jgi:hypothetical protein